MIVNFKSSKALSVSEQGKLNSYIDPAVERYKKLPIESKDLNNAEVNQEDFKNTLKSFIRFKRRDRESTNYLAS